MFTNQTSFHQLAKKELRMSSPQFRIALLRRLRMPLPLAPHRCTCGGVIDALGDHRAACATTGVLAARAPTLERAVAQICREAGARVACNVAVADMNVDNALADGRRIEVVANGLQAFHGQQLAIDATCISPISRAGAPHPGTRTDPGRAAQHAELRKRRRYPELTAARRCRLVVVAVEVGGRWGPDARQLIRALARERSTEAPPWVRAAACAGWTARWAAVVAVAVQRALATSLLELPPAGDTLTGTPPDLPDLLADTRWELPAGPSRLPLPAR